MKTTISFLLKFGKEENIKNLFDSGEIYMNTIRLFQKYDQEGIGDKFEGTSKITNFFDGQFELKIQDKPLTFNAKHFQLRESFEGHFGNIYSTYAISDNVMRKKVVHSINKRMLNFGTHCLIIKDVERFIQAILKNIEEKGFDYESNMVRYRIFDNNNHELSLFDKSHKLSYQKEHRIIAYTKKEEPLIFKIGSMHSYADLFTGSELIKDLTVSK